MLFMLLEFFLSNFSLTNFADFGPIEFAIAIDHGQLTGLTTLERTGASTIQYNHTEGHTANIHARLGLEHTNITYHMSFEASVAR